MTAIVWLDPEDPFPKPREFTQDDPQLPNGLIALSDTLDAKRLLEAYQQGIFPWYNEDQPVMWWCTSPRMVLEPQQIKISKSLYKTIKQRLLDPAWEIRIDTSFTEVMRSCANSSRHGQDGTWITPDIIEAYTALHHQGFAHSVETWHNHQLVGGLYCINLGAMVYGESMFTKVTDASKLALCALCAWCRTVGIGMIDCQQETEHLASLGAHPIPKGQFLDWIEQQVDLATPTWNWGKEVLYAYN
jgi:leucyl/phenylalanyl-tRNA--protein transferase